MRGRVAGGGKQIKSLKATTGGTVQRGAGSRTASSPRGYVLVSRGLVSSLFPYHIAFPKIGRQLLVTCSKVNTGL